MENVIVTKSGLLPTLLLVCTYYGFNLGEVKSVNATTL